MGNVAKFRPGVDVVPQGMVFSIEKLIPVPIPEPRPVHHIVNTMSKMELEDSFLYPKTQMERERISEMAARQTCYSIAKALGIRVTIWSTEDGFRVWRKK